MASDASLLAAARRLPAAYWWLIGGMLLNRLGSFVVPFLSVYLVEQRGVPVATAGAVVSLLGVGAVAASPAGGLLADRWGRRPTLLLSTTVSGAVMMALGFARPLPLLAALVLLLGFFGDLFRPAMHAAVADLVPAERRLAAYGILYWTVNMGWALSLPTAGLVSGWSWLALFLGDGATTLLFGLVVRAKVPETRPREAREAGGHPLAGLGSALADRAFRPFLILQFLFILILWQSLLALPLDMAAKGISRATFGAVLSVNAILCVAYQPFGMRIAAGRDASRVMALAGLLAGLGFGSYAFAAGPGAYAAGIAVWTAGEILNAAVAPAVVAALAPAAHRGAYQGAWTMTWGLAHFAAPALGALALGGAGARALWVGCLGLGAVVAAGQLLLGPRLRQRLARAREGGGG